MSDMLPLDQRYQQSELVRLIADLADLNDERILKMAAFSEAEAALSEVRAKIAEIEEKLGAYVGSERDKVAVWHKDRLYVISYRMSVKPFVGQVPVVSLEES